MLRLIAFASFVSSYVWLFMQVRDSELECNSSVMIPQCCYDDYLLSFVGNNLLAKSFIDEKYAKQYGRQLYFEEPAADDVNFDQLCPEIFNEVDRSNSSLKFNSDVDLFSQGLVDNEFLRVDMSGFPAGTMDTHQLMSDNNELRLVSPDSVFESNGLFHVKEPMLASLTDPTVNQWSSSDRMVSVGRPRSENWTDSVGKIRKGVKDGERKSKKMRLSCSNENENPNSALFGGDRKCTHCETSKTPQWRTGPMGPKTLCNACGVRYKSGRLLPEYRPVASPTFSLAKHSNSHKKILRMRENAGISDTTNVSVKAENQLAPELNTRLNAFSWG